MSDNGERKRRPVNVGGASLFAVLIILCLTVFAVLARITAASELALAERAAEAQSLFYQAEREAVERAAEFQAQIYNSIGDELKFSVDIDENRELRVVLRVTANGVVRDEWAVVNKDLGEPEDQGFPGGGLGVIIFD